MTSPLPTNHIDGQVIEAGDINDIATQTNYLSALTGAVPTAVVTVVAAAGSAQTLKIPSGQTSQAFLVKGNAASCRFTLSGATLNRYCEWVIEFQQSATGNNGWVQPAGIGGSSAAFSTGALLVDYVRYFTFDGGVTVVRQDIALGVGQVQVASAPNTPTIGSLVAGNSSWSVNATPSPTGSAALTVIAKVVQNGHTWTSTAKTSFPILIPDPASANYPKDDTNTFTVDTTHTGVATAAAQNAAGISAYSSGSTNTAIPTAASSGIIAAVNVGGSGVTAWQDDTSTTPNPLLAFPVPATGIQEIGSTTTSIDVTTCASTLPGSGGSSGFLGYTPGSSGTVLDPNPAATFKVVNVYTAAANTTVSSMGCVVAGGVNGGAFAFVLYAASGGVPTTVLGHSATQTVATNAAKATVTANLVGGAVTITAGQQYAVGIFSAPTNGAANTITMYQDQTAGQPTVYYTGDTGSNTYPAPDTNWSSGTGSGTAGTVGYACWANYPTAASFPAAVCQSERYFYSTSVVGGATLTQEGDFNVPAPVGLCTVWPVFSENNPSNMITGGRVMSVTIEGTIVDPYLDVYAIAGAGYRALGRNYLVNCTDGVINVKLNKVSGDVPHVQGFVVYAGAVGTPSTSSAVPVVSITTRGPQTSLNPTTYDQLIAANGSTLTASSFTGTTVAVQGVHPFSGSVDFSNKTILGFAGASFSGATNISGATWVQEGSLWYTAGQTLIPNWDQTPVDVAAPTTLGANQFVYLNNQLWIDDTYYRGVPGKTAGNYNTLVYTPSNGGGAVVASRSFSSPGVTNAGTWQDGTYPSFYFDQVNGRVYAPFNPTGHKVEVTGNYNKVLWSALFTGTNATIRNMTFEKFGASQWSSTIAMTNSVTDQCLFRFNKFAGISGFGGTLSNSITTMNGEGGLISGFKNTLNNEISYNNMNGYFAGWDAGGLKFANGVSNATISGNYVHHNYAPGIWLDTCGSNNLITKNTVLFNATSGINIEATPQITISYNLVHDNGFMPAAGGLTWWIDFGGILLSDSSGGTINNNYSYNNGGGPCDNAISNNRPTTWADGSVHFPASANSVHNNIFGLMGGRASSPGAIQTNDYQVDANNTLTGLSNTQGGSSNNNGATTTNTSGGGSYAPSSWANNAYYTLTGQTGLNWFVYNTTTMSFTAWQAAGHDSGSTITAVANTAGLPAVPVGCGSGD